MKYNNYKYFLTKKSHIKLVEIIKILNFATSNIQHGFSF